MKILFVDDDTELTKIALKHFPKTYIVDTASTGRKGLMLAESNEYDAIILDLLLPDIDGVEICKELRDHRVATPILMLTSRASVEEKISGLDAGADDYLAKPFSFKELEARLRALKRRTFVTSSKIFQAKDLQINALTSQAYYKNTELKLRKKEFLILEYLIRHQNQTVTRDMIRNYAWPDSTEPFSNAVDVHIKNLRDKIDKTFNTAYIQTMHGIGYKLSTLL